MEDLDDVVYVFQALDSRDDEELDEFDRSNGEDVVNVLEMTEDQVINSEAEMYLTNPAFPHSRSSATGIAKELKAMHAAWRM